MKTIKASLLLPLLTMLISMVISGCYTQLAFVDDEQDSAVEPSPTIIYQPIIIPIEPTAPIIMPVGPIPIDPPTQPTPPYNPLPTAGSTSPAKEQQSQPQHRDSGIQRSSESGNRQTTNTISVTRTSGSTRGGR